MLLRSVQLQRQHSLILLGDGRWPQGCAAVGMGTRLCSLPQRTQGKQQQKNDVFNQGKVGAAESRAAAGLPEPASTCTAVSSPAPRISLKSHQVTSEVPNQLLFPLSNLHFQDMILIRIMDFSPPLQAVSRHFGIMLLCDGGVVGGILYIHMLIPVQLKLFKKYSYTTGSTRTCVESFETIPNWQFLS